MAGLSTIQEGFSSPNGPILDDRMYAGGSKDFNEQTGGEQRQRPGAWTPKGHSWSPPGTLAPDHLYNHVPNADGSFTTYPPGVPAPINKGSWNSATPGAPELSGTRPGVNPGISDHWQPQGPTWGRGSGDGNSVENGSGPLLHDPLQTPTTPDPLKMPTTPAEDGGPKRPMIDDPGWISGPDPSTRVHALDGSTPAPAPTDDQYISNYMWHDESHPGGARPVDRTNAGEVAQWNQLHPDHPLTVTSGAVNPGISGGVGGGMSQGDFIKWVKESWAPSGNADLINASNTLSDQDFLKYVTTHDPDRGKLAQGYLDGTTPGAPAANSQSANLAAMRKAAVGDPNQPDFTKMDDATMIKWLAANDSGAWGETAKGWLNQVNPGGGTGGPAAEATPGADSGLTGGPAPSIHPNTSIDDYMKALPDINKIVPSAWRRLDLATKQFLAGAYIKRGDVGSQEELQGLIDQLGAGHASFGGRYGSSNRTPTIVV